MSRSPSVSIVIPNWNGRELLEEFLPSVIAAAEHYRQCSGSEAEIIVVDDASGDGSAEWLSNNYASLVRVAARAKNGGFARAANSGFAAASHPLVFLLNNDIKVEPDAIAPLAAHFDDERVFAVCCKAYRLGTDHFDGAGKLGRFEKGFWRVFLSYDVLPSRLPSNKPRLRSFVASGGYSVFDRSKFNELGGFSELLSPFYWEDVDLCWRAWKRGWEINYEPASVVHHKSSATIGAKIKVRHVQIVSERNRLLMHWMNLHDRRWMAEHLFWLALKLLGAAFSFDGAYWRSFLDALKLLHEARQTRAVERASSEVSDREIDKIFSNLASNDWAVVIRNLEDYYRYMELRKRLDDFFAAENTESTER